jgi:hypothetical protein
MATTTPQVPTIGTSMPHSGVVAATAFALAGALRLTAATVQLDLSAGFAVFFFVVAAGQIGYGILLGIGAHRAMTTFTATAAMVITLALVGLWLVATTATTPVYPLMTGPYPVDVIDLGTAVLELTSVVALCKSLPQPARRRVTWTLVGLVALVWLAWVAIVVTNGLLD